VHAARIIIALAAVIAGCRPGGGEDPDPTLAGETGEDASCGADWSGDATAIPLPAGYP
jgi:hypothetical protein